MEADYMSVDTGALRSHSQNLGEQADASRAALENLRTSLDTLGKPWGHDDAYAEAFEQVYVPACKQILEAFETFGEGLRNMSQAVRGAAVNYETADTESAV
ncbi:WXG100 family type VII secretion target [Streptomyces sp. NPDC002573]|uniref:WXG100 family type VII secretion target n=1 Tax=Streptomyces sp. NPDC002573 TaxID=3364651 RepID=UPI00369D865C